MLKQKSSSTDKPFLIYRSSAGSGKTYTLAIEYLSLALKSPQAFRSILAVTFTNKATREMKTRIIEFLYGLRHAERPDLLPPLMAATGLDEKQLAERARQVLSAILHGYSFFSVMTIDSFFQKVIRAFAREMGLQAGFVLELDQDAVLDEVIDQLLSELGNEGEKQLREWLIRFSEEKVESGKAWDFRSDIKRLAYELLKEEYKLQQRQLPEAKVNFYQMLTELKAIVAKFDKAMQSYGERALNLMQQHGLDITDFAYGRSGVAGYFIRLKEGGDYDPKQRAREAYLDTDKWTTKSSKKKAEVQQLLDAGLQTLLRQAIDHYDAEHISYHSALQLLRFIYAFGILKRLEDKLDAYKKENDLMLISDAGIFLSEIIGREDTPFIYEKIGSSFQHYLIDEFQDTSGLQWANFRPLVENSLNEGRRNLVVGDVKQSIYRWRGGDWQLLLEKIQQDISPWHTEVRQLDRNFRSRKEVVSFNNALFSHLPKLLQAELLEKIEQLDDLSLKESLSARLPIISRAYAEAAQALPEQYPHKADWHGYVSIDLLAEEENTEEDAPGWKEQVKQKLPGLVEKLQDRGYALKDIAFLVRDKKAGKEVVDTFMQYKNEGRARSGYSYELISSESLYLNASLVVSLLIDIMTFLDKQDDALAKGSIAYKYLKMKGEDISSEVLHKIFMTAGIPPSEEGDRLFMELLPEAFVEYYPYLNKLPLYEMVENLVRLFDLNQPGELAFLQAFQDAVLQYTQQQTGDLHSFLRWWHDKGKHTSVQVSEEVDAMRILTIHKAKGLQFKVVILPFCDWEMDHRRGLDNILWTQAEEEPFQSFGLMPLRYGSALAQTVFSRDYYEEQIRAYLDNLNLLYVAFTRAEECLYAFASPKIRSRGNVPLDSVANALYQALPSLAKSQPGFRWQPEERKFEAGHLPEAHISGKHKQEWLRLESYPAERWRDRLSIRPYARHYFELDEEGNLQPRPAILIRDVLQQLRTPDQLPQLMDKLYFERGLSPAYLQQLREEVDELLKKEPLSDWFSGAYDHIHIGWKLLDGEGQAYQVHRVLLSGEQAIILQFYPGSYEKEENEREVLHATTILRSMGKKVTAYLYDTSRKEANTL
ncbi:MAG: UvrD-helicase domain-containing protein [Cyclobacteriaceae bacterium]